jgi:GDPmannose 4,6-dehydratase
MRKHKGTRLFFAASSEIFGRNQPADYEETSSIAPVTPYGLSKAHCLQMLKLLREQEGLQVTTGILFNHESHLRPESFVTMKICKGFKNFVSNGLCMSLGSLDSERDWGMATDFVKAYSELLSGGHTGEFVIATGRRLRVRDFVESVARHFGVELEWHGHGADEFATCKKTGKRVLQVDPQFFRKDEPLAPCGNVTKLKNALGWSPSQSVDELVKLMCKEMK